MSVYNKSNPESPIIEKCKHEILMVVITCKNCGLLININDKKPFLRNGKMFKIDKLSVDLEMKEVKE